MGKAKVKVLVAHSGLHGSYIRDEEPIIDLDNAKSLEKAKYVKILSVEEDPEVPEENLEGAEIPEDKTERKETAKKKTKKEKR